jgi:hypothetical protein
MTLKTPIIFTNSKQKMMHFRFFFFLTLAVTSIALACTGDRERILEGYINERVTEFERKHTAQKEIQLLKLAGGIADSLLLDEAIASVKDSLGNRKPSRPMEPPRLEPLDSGPVQPIFDRDTDQ